MEEAKSINLSLSALGKCINALAENSAHVPIRDSKLTRLLRDSFGGKNYRSLASICSTSNFCQLILVILLEVFFQSFMAVAFATPILIALFRTFMNLFRSCVLFVGEKNIG